ncbi:MAG TPA: hypothetical protein VF789_25780 [Thermoanaerobaculia bacterium]
MRKHLVLAVLIAAVCFAVAVPAVAADRVIRGGIDIWATKPDATTHYDFADNAIPAGFFCANSEPFTGMIYLKGSPIATGTPGALGNADTIVERLDDAVFAKNGVATTRIRMRALSLVSMAPVKTSCGLFNAKVTLDGDQPTTIMRIVRETRDGGSYIAPLAFNARIEFTPVEGGRFVRPRVLRKSIQFMAKPNATWTSRPPADLVTHKGFVKVDTDGDGAPDAFLEGTSNFSAAGDPAAKLAAGCHCADAACTKQHCPTGVYPVLGDSTIDQQAW